jgi:hypothetical protein
VFLYISAVFTQLLAVILTSGRVSMATMLDSYAERNNDMMFQLSLLSLISSP